MRWIMAGIFLVFYSFTKDLIDASLESNQVTIKGGLGLWCSNATFNPISVISWQSVLLVDETRVHRENH
jgi:hypothetical protein